MTEKDLTWNMNVNLNEFPRETLLAIKNISDKNNAKREWFANVYHHGGSYVVGAPVMGTYSGVKVQPDEQAVKDKFYTGVKECMSSGGGDKGSCIDLMNNQVQASGGSGKMFASDTHALGTRPEELVFPLHMHPIKAFEMPDTKRVRSMFSGTDIGSEFAASIRDNKNYRLGLIYPRVEKGKRHTMFKMITFPGKQSYEVMRASNPHLTQQQIMSLDDKGTNYRLVDWYKYQEEAKKRGHIQEIDIEDKTGVEAYSSYSNYYMYAVVAGLVLLMGGVWFVNHRRKKKAKS